MRISEIYQAKPFGVSIEIFPPKTEAGGKALFETLAAAARWNPAFVSCTYGAGGSTRTQTLDLCTAIQDQFGLTATAHFTCVGSTRDEQLEWLTTASDRGIHNIMALRGDPPDGQASFQQVEGGFAHASELVSLIREVFPHIGIGVAGYPEKHPEAPDAQSDLDHLKRKVEYGADAVYTQLFYDNDSFLVDNPYDRYVINDRSRPRYNPDGSLDLYIQPTEPSDPVKARNWLPSPPADAETRGFRILMRLYGLSSKAVKGVLSGKGWQGPTILPCDEENQTSTGISCAG